MNSELPNFEMIHIAMNEAISDFRDREITSETIFGLMILGLRIQQLQWNHRFVNGVGDSVLGMGMLSDLQLTREYRRRTIFYFSVLSLSLEFGLKSQTANCQFSKK